MRRCWRRRKRRIFGGGNRKKYRDIHGERREIMFGLSESELFFYGGIAIMAAAGILAALCIVVFLCTGRRLKKKLEQEYGKPQL